MSSGSRWESVRAHVDAWTCCEPLAAFVLTRPATGCYHAFQAKQGTNGCGIGHVPATRIMHPLLETQGSATGASSQTSQCCAGAHLPAWFRSFFCFHNPYCRTLHPRFRGCVGCKGARWCNGAGAHADGMQRCDNCMYLARDTPIPSPTGEHQPEWSVAWMQSMVQRCTKHGLHLLGASPLADWPSKGLARRVGPWLRCTASNTA